MIVDFLYRLKWQDLVDIIILSMIIYRIILMLQGTRTVQILAGLLVLIIAFYFSSFLQLDGVSWVLTNLFNSLVIAIIVLFQADFRNALARMGSKTLFREAKTTDAQNILELVFSVCQHLSKSRVGALIVLENEMGLKDYYTSATKISGDFSPQLLAAIFTPNAPLHDGAVIINRQQKIAYAGCILPLSARIDFAQNMGTRHRAALGLSEESDAVVLVVSEETGQISLAFKGELFYQPDASFVKERLKELLKKLYP
ncbi:MAG: diadenylate cyclase CdaA [Deltaproteobacteria bacterium]|nr:diadenylate cyclase CdaA [Deltaproteobacteria bacterium]